MTKKTIKEKPKEVVKEKGVIITKPQKLTEAEMPSFPALPQTTSMAVDSVLQILSDPELLRQYKRKKKAGLDMAMISKVETLLKNIKPKEIKDAKLKAKVWSIGVLMDKIFPPREQAGFAQQLNFSDRKINIHWKRWNRKPHSPEEKTTD